MSTIFEKLSARLQGRQQKTQQTFDALVRQLADDGKPALEQIEAVLSDADKTPEDLQAAVERLTKRRQAAAAVARGKAVPQERAQAEAAMVKAAAAVDAEIRAAQAKYAAACEPAQRRLRELDAIEKAAESAESFLRESANAPDEKTAAELADLHEKLSAAQLRRDDARHKAHTIGRNAAAARAFANSESSGNAMVSYEARKQKAAEADHLEKQLAELLPVADTAAAEAEAISARVTEIQQTALAPER